MNFQERVIEGLIAHGPLTVGYLAAIWFSYPYLFKKSMSNGGGALVREIVANENEIQSYKNRAVVADALKEHEKDEARRFEEITDRIELVERRQWEGGRHALAMDEGS